MATSRFSLLASLLGLFLALFSTIEARPWKRRIAQSIEPRAISQYNVPVSAGSQSLPPPSGTLKYVTIGRGTQNYTCSAAASTPVFVGALAELIDASPILNLLPPTNGGQAIFDLIPSFLIDFDLPTILDADAKVIGHHYFNGAGVPTFDLGSRRILLGKGVGDIPAPATASAGPFNQGYGAISWKNLIDAGGSVGLSEVYRVETAGGKAQPSCGDFVGAIEIQYAAMYWFFK